MPWTAAQMVQKGAKDGKRAAMIANAVLRKCQSERGTDCEGKAIRIALSKVNKGT